MKYTVTLVRRTYDYAEVTVEADDPTEALAQAEANNVLIFHPGDPTEVEVEAIGAVRTEPAR